MDFHPHGSLTLFAGGYQNLIDAISIKDFKLEIGVANTVLVDSIWITAVSLTPKGLITVEMIYCTYDLGHLK